jgi:hypothetical protein
MALVDAIANVITTLADGDLFYVGEDLTGSYQDGRVSASVIKSYVLTGPLAVIGSSSAGASIRLPEDTDNGSNYVALKAPDTLGANITFTLPNADGSNGHVLTTNGSGVLSFAAPSGGASAPLTLAGGTVTDPSTPLTITQTWNDGADTFDALVVNVTNTASSAASRLVDLKVGGTTQLAVTRQGFLKGVTNGTVFSGTTVAVDDYLFSGSIFAVGSPGGQYADFVIETASQNKLIMNSGMLMGFGSQAGAGGNASDLRGSLDASFSRVGAGVIGVRSTSGTTGGALNFLEQTAPAAPGANQAVIYAEDNGSGKTRLMVRFPTGAAQVLATEP